MAPRTTTTPDSYAQQPQGRATLYNQIYSGFVRKVDDENLMGRLKVWIPDLSGDSDREETWYTVDYCSPFAGATPIKKFDNNRDSQWKNGNIKDGKKYTESQISYGWWAVPPDIDNEVICMFINGDPAKGIWVGSLYKQFMNHMTPGLPVGESFDEAACDAEQPPVGEYNKFSEIGNNPDPTRPRYDPLHDGLKMQGLYTDKQRGTATSGARRDSISKVYGYLTPDGSQLYADDNEENEFIRFRTKTGAQVFIHETCGYIYMNSKKGNSWVQISDNGVDVYSTKFVNVRAMDGINMHSDKDFNLHVANNMNVFVGGDTKWATQGNWDQQTGKDHKLDIGGAYHSTIEKNRTQLVKGTDSLDVKGNLTVNSDMTFTMTAGQLILMKSPMIKQNCSDKPNEPDVPAEANTKPPCTLPDRTLEECYPESETQSVVTILPTHEPYKGHEVICSGEAYLVAKCPDGNSTDSDGDGTPDDEDTTDNTDNVDDPTNPDNPNNPDDPNTPSNDNPNDSNSGGGSGGSSGGGGGGSGGGSGGGGGSSGGSGSGSSGGSSSGSGSSGGGGSSGSGSGSGSGNGNTSNTNQNPNNSLQDAIATSSGSDAGSGYNQTANNNAYAPSQNLTNKSMDQINQLQNQMKTNPSNTSGTTGAGRYNLSQQQVQQAKAGIGKGGGDPFSASTQDAMANYLLNQAGIKDWRDGKIPDSQIIDNIAQQFPTMPTSTGKTPTGGEPGIPLEVVKEILQDIKNPSKPSPIDESTTPTDSPKASPICLGIVRNGVNVGTGTVIDYSGTLVTNAQVIGILTAQVGQYVTVEIGGRIRIARVIALNPSKDIAHIRLSDFKDLTPIDRAGLTSSSQLRAYGYAFGKTITCVYGSPSGQINKTVTYVGPGNPPGGLVVYGLSVMTTQNAEALKPGMAGGPVLDSAGNMIGIISANASSTNTAYYVPF